MKKIKVIVADDHPLVCEGLKKVVAEDSDDMEVTDVAHTGPDLLYKLSENLPDIVILDITLPGRGGLDLLKDIHNLYPKLPVLILTIHPEHRYAARAIKAGASGYLNKSVVADELVNAIRVIVTQNKRYITPLVGEQLANQMDVNFDRPLHDQLSDREYEILRMIAGGKKVSEIAKEYSLAVQTIHTYRRRILDKMNMKSDIELVKYATLNNLFD
jgi:two-component system, NarL family, invasion response regulator UvrY